MPRYYLHLRHRDGLDGLAVDHEGDELPDPAALREHLEATARDLMGTTRIGAIPDWKVCTFEVTDEAGRLILVPPFDQVSSRR